jgi:hypothetical protein
MSAQELKPRSELDQRQAITPTAQAYAELQTAFDHYNQALFDGLLPNCLITMQREKRTCGYFSRERFVHRERRSKTDEIALNPAYFAVVPLLETLQTLVHEMVHAWQYNLGNPGRRSYHNKEWAEKMESIGLMPSDTGRPGGARTGEKMADYPIAGGRFMQATEVLVSEGFGISWLDRFPSDVPMSIGAIANDEATPRPAPGLGADLGELITMPEAGNRSNRSKYRCPGCGVQAWGKPGLRLICGGDQCGMPVLEPA